MTIQAAVRFPFRGLRPWINILLLAVCHLIPVVGPLVALGYGAMVEKKLARNLEADPLVFDFANFTKYLERGVPPFVVSLIASLVLIPVMWLLGFVGFLVVALAVAAKISPWAIVLCVGVAILVFLGLMMFLGVLFMPLLLRASLLGKIGAAFDFRWCLDFTRKVFWPAVGYLLLIQLIAFGLMIAGMAVLCVGMYAALAIVILMQLHVRMQLYHLYLDRGGTPLAFIDEPIPPAFPVIQQPFGG